MIIDCCTKEEPAVDSKCEADAVNQVVPERCRACGEQGAPVSRKTVLLMLKPDLLEQALTGIYRFCATRECPTVYFEEHGARVLNKNSHSTIRPNGTRHCYHNHRVCKACIRYAHYHGVVIVLATTTAAHSLT